MKALIDYEDYKKYTADRVTSMPGGGRGEWLRIAEALKVHTSLISQIFRGTKNLTPEQAQALTEHFGLGELESEYYLLLVQAERAGNRKLRQIYQRRMQGIQEESRDLRERFKSSKILSDSDQAVFYSRWSYSGVRLAASLPGQGSPEQLASDCGLSREQVNRILDFLLQRGLLTRTNQGRYELGTRQIHVPADSPWVIQHHRNWRLKTIERLERSPRIEEPELVFTSPLTIAAADMSKVRALILQFIEDLKTIVSKTEPDSLACLNIDWVKHTGHGTQRR
jgi:uncharacterized protein (TIGR02147 family)